MAHLGGKIGRLLASVVMALGVGACTPHPPATAYQRKESHALVPDKTTKLGKAVTPLVEKHPGQSGFQLLPNGRDAFLTRIAMIEAAERTVDLQYYSLGDDRTGKMLLEALIKAADHGVRVRVLMDDLNLAQAKNTLLVLNSHSNIEVRVFNPFATKDDTPFSQVSEYITNFKRWSRRMHNKSFIVDNQIAIMGGRNLGDEYFGFTDKLLFRDLDLLCVGPLPQRISASFDRYWNSELAYPISVLNPPMATPKTLDELHQNLNQFWEQEVRAGELRGLIPLPQQLLKQQVKLVWAEAELAADKPEKIENAPHSGASAPARSLRELTAKAQKEVLIVSPYFVPREAGLAWVKGLHDRGVKVVVLTNSLASTDVTPVHSHYSKYREDLLAQGVDLYELKAEHHSRRNGRKRPVALHTKVYVVDRQTMVIGSFNLDPRSVSLNTEMVAVIHSAELAEQAAQFMQRVTNPENSYHLRTTPDLVWETIEGGKPKTLHSEPEASLWRRLKAGIFSLLPIEDQL